MPKPSSHWDWFDENFPWLIPNRKPEILTLQDPEAIPVLITLLLDEDNQVAGFADGNLSVIGEPAVGPVVKVLENPNPMDRILAISFLARMALRKEGLPLLATYALPALRKATLDPDPEVAEEAKEAVKDIEELILQR